MKKIILKLILRPGLFREDEFGKSLTTILKGVESKRSRNGGDPLLRGS